MHPPPVELGHRRRVADGGDAAGTGVPGAWGLPGMNASHLDGRGGVARSVARRRASAPSPLPGIARRSSGRRRAEAAVDGSIDLVRKQAPKDVKKEEQGEGRKIGCRVRPGSHRSGRGVRVYRRRVAAMRAPIWAAWRRAG